MRAAVFHGPHRPLSIEEVEIDTPRPREMIVRTVASGGNLRPWYAPPRLILRRSVVDVLLAHSDATRAPILMERGQ